MITVYGSSDDLIEIEGDINEEFLYSNEGEVDGNILAFSDGTVIRIMFGNNGIWRISPVTSGTAVLLIKQAPEDDDRNYSDRATLSTAIAIKWVVQGIAYAATRTKA